MVDQYGSSEVVQSKPIPNTSCSPSKSKLPLSSMSNDEEALLRRFEATLDDSHMLDPVVNFDEEELLSSIFKRKGRSKPKTDSPKLKIDNKIMKKATKGKAKAKMDEDIGDDLLSALLNSDITPEKLELCYGPNSDRNNP